MGPFYQFRMGVLLKMENLSEKWTNKWRKYLLSIRLKSLILLPEELHYFFQNLIIENIKVEQKNISRINAFGGHLGFMEVNSLHCRFEDKIYVIEKNSVEIKLTIWSEDYFKISTFQEHFNLTSDHFRILYEMLSHFPFFEEASKEFSIEAKEKYMNDLKSVFIGSKVVDVLEENGMVYFVFDNGEKKKLA